MTKILVVEDEPRIARILQRLLARNGYDYVGAGNRKEALELAVSEKPDCILMDVKIPDEEGLPENETGGLEATRSLKTSSETSSIPVIAITGQSMSFQVQAIFEAGCDDMVAKPFQDFAPLLEKIAQYAGGSPV